MKKEKRGFKQQTKNIWQQLQECKLHVNLITGLLLPFSEDPVLFAKKASPFSAVTPNWKTKKKKKFFGVNFRAVFNFTFSVGGGVP